MNNTERLIGKMNDELAAFVAGLERLPVQDVIEKAGEIAVKTDMALLVEEAFLGPKETKALLGMRMPLEYLYQEYLKKDTGLSNVLIVFPEARTARTVVLVIMVIVDVIYVVAYESWEHSND